VTRQWATPEAAALSHARRGWTLVPLKPGTGHPARKWKNLAYTPPGSIARWWPGPWFNPGIVLRDMLVVVDLDDAAAHGTGLPPEWAGASHGAEVLAALAGRAGETVAPTYTVTSWRGGTHLYYLAPEGREIRNSAGRVGPMIDIRGQGGMVVGAGSVREGKPYEVADDRDPVILPAWLAELATKRAPAAEQHDTSALTSARDTRGYGAAALRAEVDIVLGAGRGHRNDALNRAAFSLGQLVASGDLAEADVTSALTAAAKAAGLADDDGAGTVNRTIASGISAGKARPRSRRAA
jgi:hypothetical protein